jgi:hypothetical protein
VAAPEVKMGEFVIGELLIVICYRRSACGGALLNEAARSASFDNK